MYKQRKLHKKAFDLIFILLATTMLVFLSEYGILEKYIAFSLIPIVISYLMGQYSERKFRK